VRGKILVTGRAGFIASHLSELLLVEGLDVSALDDLSTGSEANVAHLNGRDGFHLIVDFVLSPAVVSELVHRCDAVFHLAAAVGVRLIVRRRSGQERRRAQAVGGRAQGAPPPRHLADGGPIVQDVAAL
jgi:nucleoside-diphosphate-sugar epimerase